MALSIISSEGLRSEIVRARLPLVALALLVDASGHSYALIERSRNEGFERIQGGTLNPLLRRLEERGFVIHEWRHDEAGPGRKNFFITAAGREELARARADWSRVGQSIERA